MKYTKVIYAVCIIFVIYLGLFYLYSQKPKQPTKTATINHHTFSVILAKTSQEQAKGLGQRASLPPDQGMLFPFGKAEMLHFWMKDMEFPIDIIFIRDNTIVSIAPNAPALKVPESKLPIYSPTQPSDSVLEINAGLSQKYNFKTGDTVTISQ
ncbi:MAG: DUF192 domain-containing protein [Candidatus Levyibacteriota bacterium]